MLSLHLAGICGEVAELLVLRPVWWMMSLSFTGFFPLKSVYRV